MKAGTMRRGFQEAANDDKQTQGKPASWRRTKSGHKGEEEADENTHNKPERDPNLAVKAADNHTKSIFFRCKRV